ncbi:MAG: response regulator [Rhodospirillales bacterium]|nr:response regulator [Alphaproteobacteria bacterium]USO03698.1 MAG: response regulator [Rhodospirillales bacterium]
MNQKSAYEDFSRLKLLIVEDQMEARTILRNMLGELGVTQIFEAGDGREALSFLDMASDLVELIICDWNMPNMSGLEFLSRIRSDGCNIPFLIISGRGDRDSVLKAKAGGVSGYIRKPFSSAQLEVKLRVLMQRMVEAQKEE